MFPNHNYALFTSIGDQVAQVRDKKATMNLFFVQTYLNRIGDQVYLLTKSEALEYRTRVFANRKWNVDVVA